MKFDYDKERDLMYIYFMSDKAIVETTKTVMPGIYADFDSSGKLIGIELLDASDFMGDKIEMSDNLISNIAG